VPATNAFPAPKIRTGEWLIERGIVLVAGVSIALIFLILAFVLREAAPVLQVLSSSSSFSTASSSSASSATSASTQSAAPNADLRPEVYNPDVEPPAEEISAEKISAEKTSTLAAAPNADLRPEVYNPDVEPPAEKVSPEEAKANATLKNKSAAAEPRSGWLNFLGTAWQPVSSVPKFGIMPLVVGTAKTTFVAIALGAPLGILAALYAAFFAPKRFREVIKPMVELLAGFPSVVIGFFCLLAVGSAMQALFGLQYRLNAFVGGIGLAIAVIPIVFTITEDALSAVPKSLLEAALAMGATTWEAAYKVMLPAAFPGVFAAVLLGVGRAFGETMIALMATGNAALFSASATDPARTLAATIGSEMGEVIWGSTHYGILFMLGVLLFLVSFTLNAITEFFVKERLAKKLQGQ
jgi:phosphate transport system permease protein